MAQWRKVLTAMLTDPKPRSYTYDEAANVLTHLGFTLAARRRGSHRLFNMTVSDPSIPTTGRRTVHIGLVDSGRGTLPPEYVKDMVRTLLANSLVPDEV